MATKKKATTAKKVPAKKAQAKKRTKTQTVAAKNSTAKALEARQAEKKSPQAVKKVAPKKAAPKKAAKTKAGADIGGPRPSFLDAKNRPKTEAAPARTAPSVPIKGAKRPARAAVKAAEAPEAPAKGKRTRKGAKAAGKANGRTDMYGFREGSKDSKAAAMYARKSGATTPEIKKVLGQPHLNCLKAIEKGGHKVKRVKEVDNKTKKSVTRYYVTA